MAYIYLDESGQFDEKTKRNVIGGFFSIEELDKGSVESFFNLFDKTYFNEKGQFHGRELSNEYLSYFIDKLIDFLNSKNSKPVLFIPKKRFFFINDSVTYINILSDGIVKFLKRIEGKYSISSLKIVIEGRKGSSKEDYTQRITEAIEKRKVLSNLLTKDLKVEIIIATKNNRFLQMADAIVHTFYRLNSNLSYHKQKPLDTAIVEKFNNWVEWGKIHVYSSENLNDLINDYVYEGDYIYAFLQLVNSIARDQRLKRNKKKSRHEVVENFINNLCQLDLANLNTILQSVLSLYYNAINVKRYLSEFEHDIIFVLQHFLPRMEHTISHFNKRTEDINWAYCYCYMILLTLYNHKGDCEKFEEIYEKAYTFIKSIPFDLDSLANSIRIKVLHGVHLTNMYQFQQCFKEMKDLEKKVTDAFYFLRESDENIEVKPKIVGEITGTKLQAAMYDALIGKSNSWDQVRGYSDNALQSFVHSDDIYRQYQYRAQIETYAGCYQEAREYLAKSIGLEKYTNDEDLLKKIVQDKLVFPLLHFLRIYYVELMRGLDNSKQYYDIVAKVFATYNDEFNSIKSLQAYPLPTILHYLMVLYWLNDSNNSKKKALQFYQDACSLYSKDNNITLLTIERNMTANSIWLKAYVNNEDTKNDKTQYLFKFEKLLSDVKNLPIHNYLQKVKSEYEKTPEKQWNTFWYYFPF
ncbi:MAG: DUF3800 domain-containing protein [Spirochaetota bacterium]